MADALRTVLKVPSLQSFENLIATVESFNLFIRQQHRLKYILTKTNFKMFGVRVAGLVVSLIYFALLNSLKRSNFFLIMLFLLTDPNVSGISSFQIIEIPEQELKSHSSLRRHLSELTVTKKVIVLFYTTITIRKAQSLFVILIYFKLSKKKKHLVNLPKFHIVFISFFFVFISFLFDFILFFVFVSFLFL